MLLIDDQQSSKAFHNLKSNARITYHLSLPKTMCNTTMNGTTTNEDGSKNDAPNQRTNAAQRCAPRALIELSLRNVTYQPLLMAAAKAASPRHQKKKGVQRFVVLNQVSTTIKPYQLTAWMGPSGST
jgi:ABC-type multidrug transport system fused ATPase/permease subunit